MAHSVTIDRRIIEWRQIDRRKNVGSDDATASGSERHRLDFLHWRDALINQPLHLLERHQRSGECEAVVGELRHQLTFNPASGTACLSSASATASISLRSIAGSLVSGTGASDAMATICGSSGCNGGLPFALRKISILGNGSRLKPST